MISVDDVFPEEPKAIRSEAGALLMPPLKPFESGLLPRIEMDTFTKNINMLIDNYNKTDISSEKETILKHIMTVIKEIDYKFPQPLLAGSPGYRESCEQLFTDVKQQMQRIGHPSMLSPSQSNSPLSEIIANMTQTKIDALLAILVKRSNPNLAKELNELYSPDDMDEEAQNFRQFISTHRIEYLGGANSNNFKLTAPDGRSTVLKVDNHLDLSRTAEAHLRHRVNDLFNPIATERTATCYKSQSPADGIMTRTLLVTKHYPAASLNEEAWGVNQSRVPPEQIALYAGSRFIQMASAMLKIKDAGCLFSDAKLGNWLVDENNQLQIADTKGFVFINPDTGNYDKDYAGNEYNRIIRTQGFRPPEFHTEDAKNADKVHAFILGKNLYQYMVGTFTLAENSTDFDFNSPVFKTKTGEKIKTLIEGLVHQIPAKRMSVETAMAAMDAIPEVFLFRNPAIKASLDALKAQGIGHLDKKMDEFIQSKTKEIMLASPEERVILLRDLDHKCEQLRNNEIVNYIKHDITDFRHRTGLMSFGSQAKADRIERALSEVPIEQRFTMNALNVPAQILTAQASQRLPSITGAEATSFKKFKEQYRSIAPAQSSTKPIPKEDDPSPSEGMNKKGLLR